MPVIEVDHVTKEFRLGQQRSLKRTLLELGERLRGRDTGRPPFKALDDVSFSVEPGEVLGIIGHNGAGKSTLLKILAGISKPTKGRVAVRGRVAPLIEVGAGLVPDLTGRENIFVNGTILGMRRVEIQKKFDEIVAFSELEKFIDTPVKRYSSGMQVRLGFSIATSVDAEILIVDEVLAVGDLVFQRKSFDRIETLIRKQHRTVILVSHNIRQVERVCTRALMLDRGRLRMDGAPAEVGNAFFDLSDAAIQRQSTRRRGVAESWPEVELINITLEQPGRPTRDAAIHYDEGVEIIVRFRAKKRLERPTFGIGIHTTDLLYLSKVDTDMQYRRGAIPVGEFAVRWRIDRFPLLPGVYALSAGVASGEVPVYHAENLLQFRVLGPRLSRAQASEQGFVALVAHADLIEVGSGTQSIVELDRSKVFSASNDDL
jgi:ABC-type polysaccharide/polyol phosphate transport system ATPase subunit